MSHPGRTGLLRARHIPELDGLRGIAILIVAISHYTEQTAGKGLDDVVFRTAQSGWVGVDLFFCLSGFLITGILLDSKDSPHYLRNFFLRRALRIFPLYYAALALYVCFFRTISDPGDQQIHPLWLFGYGTNIVTAMGGWPPRFVGHFWSLAVEEQFYAVWPFLVLAISRRRLLYGCGIFWGSAVLLRFALSAWQRVDPTSLYVLTPLRIDPLMAGALLAIALRDPSLAGPVARWSRLLLPAAAFAIVTLGVRHAGYFYWEWSAWQQAAGYAALAIGGGSSIGVAVTSAGAAWPRRVLRARALVFFGKYSYAIYVFHVWLDTLARRQGLHPAQAFLSPALLLPALALYVAVQLALASGAALLSWHLLEKHALAPKTRFDSHQLARRSAAFR